MDLVEALREAMRRRERNTASGGVVIRALLGLGWTYRVIEEECGLPVGTAHRWAHLPGGDA